MRHPSTPQRAARIPAAALLILAAHAHAQPRIVDLGQLPGANFTHGQALSSNARAASGSGGSAIFTRAFHWTPTLGIRALEPLPGGLDSYAYTLSANGSVVAGGSAISSSQTRAARWVISASGTPGQAESLGVLAAGTDSTAIAANGDGSVIVGWSDSKIGHRAFRWTPATGMEDIGTLPGGLGSFASGVSSDGATICGTSDMSLRSHAFRWTAATGMEGLGTLPGHDYSMAHAISADGNAIAGESGVTFTFPPPPELPLRAFRWLAGGGTPTMQDLGLLPGGSYSRALAISADGSAVAGTADASIPGGGAESRAFLWTEPLGIVDLNTYLPTLGINLNDWTLTDALALNHDGAAILGHGFHKGYHTTFIAIITHCYANCDESTTPPILNIDDFTCFISEFAAASALPHQQQLEHYANCDGRTSAPALNVDDFTCFINAFAAGCP